MLYTFQAVSPPNIRRSELYTQHLVYVAVAASKLDIYQMLYVQFWAPDDGRRNRLKHDTNKEYCITLHLVGYLKE